ncbi:hypothetical protein MIND_00033400 [Mycena indigotica]|uniref:Glycosyltransferase family 32 protein n=1 Tax=Mycena indigotica TaxID=2126181 RepID=A0A8H6TG90_9AGAR|nr:uncharacterized protein MIND_00033400 [Mycena indigotica]KAF7315190.1 hypothetical protein MIND_00033400 [Mycena indigotica]
MMPHLRDREQRTATSHRPLLSLPKYHDKDEKYGKRQQQQPWHRVPLSVGRFRFQLWLPNIRIIHTRLGRKRGILAFVLTLLLAGFALFALGKRFASKHKSWPGTDSPTLVFKRESLARVWLWEIASGHHPSYRTAPPKLGLKTITNPAVPPHPASVSRFKPSASGVGPKRMYINLHASIPNVAYPPRPIPGSIADLDIIIEKCDFGEGKYVRDCLEFLRVSGGLDNGDRVRRGDLESYKYIFTEDAASAHNYIPSLDSLTPAGRKGIIRSEHEAYLDEGFAQSRHTDSEPPISLPPLAPLFRYSPENHVCDPEDPRIFHIYWTGPFTDKPYFAILSFLFTQNTQLHVAGEVDANHCPPQLWVWINLGPAAAVGESATRDLVAELKSNVWAAPFLHPRFKHVIHFKLWNTAEQLDSLPETSEWRSKKTIFKSGGHILSTNGDQDHNANLTGSLSPTLYDKLSVIMSDMARFILCYKYGGIYVDADTLFLRDWEELWNWKGAYAYRWSWHDKYNTAVLRLRKGSALAHFLIRTAVKNGFDFHPFEITKYLKEGQLVHLLTRLPDAMFDGAWLNMEGYQRERPPQPFFTLFEDFFVTPVVDSGAPAALGFRGFFSGAYSYHFHNNWWNKVDPARNWPDLGPNFQGQSTMDENLGDRRDLDWSTVLKRTFESYLRGERPNMYGEFLVI